MTGLKRTLNLDLLLVTLMTPMVHAESPALGARVKDLVKWMGSKPARLLEVGHQEQALYQAGLHHHWQRYQSTLVPNPKDFRGYILFSDPYHRGLKRISFLLGSDCSNFVHRVFQILGAPYSFAKTRHWVTLRVAMRELAESTDKTLTAEALYPRFRKEYPGLDLSLCAWKNLLSRFEPISSKELETGDLVVHADQMGPRGAYGHMGIAVRQETKTLVLQSKFPEGYTLLPLEKSFGIPVEEVVSFRYRGEMEKYLPARLEERLKGSYPEDPSGCE
jgi:hypothetical protein